MPRTVSSPGPKSHGFWDRRGFQEAQAATLKPTTLLAFHRALKERKYRRLFSPQRRGKPGPRGPSKELIRVIVDMKRRNPRYGCPRIAQQVSKAFGIEIDKDVVRRVLAKYYWPRPSDEARLG